MSKTNDILSQRIRRMERTLDRVAFILEDEVALRINIHKEQAALMGKMRSSDKTENVVAMLALVRHHCELGGSAKSNGWRPNVNANEVNGFAGDPMIEHDKLVAEADVNANEAARAAAPKLTGQPVAWRADDGRPNAKFEKRRIHEELVNHTYEDASGIRTCKVQRYAYCVCAAYPSKHAYATLRGDPTFRALNSEAEAMEIAFTGNGVYAFRCEALAESKTWELISPVRKEGEEDEKPQH